MVLCSADFALFAVALVVHSNVSEQEFAIDLVEYINLFPTKDKVLPLFVENRLFLSETSRQGAWENHINLCDELRLVQVFGVKQEWQLRHRRERVFVTLLQCSLKLRKEGRK